MLESLKKDVVAMAKRAQKEGLCKHLSGNLSARDPETNLTYTSPIMIAIPAIVNKAIAETPAARPSRPSIRLIALVIPTIQNTVITDRAFTKL